MITGRGLDGQGRPLLLIGLSGENMTRLMADEPIVIDAARFGVGEFTVLLMGGRTEDSMAQQVMAVLKAPAPIRLTDPSG